MARTTFKNTHAEITYLPTEEELKKPDCMGQTLIVPIEELGNYPKERWRVVSTGNMVYNPLLPGSPA